MESEARYTYVGIGLVALIAALVAAVLWLKNVGGKGDFERYAIHFEQQELAGLEVGAAVTLRGIKVGRVEDYALVGNKLNRVRVQVRVDRRAPVLTNTQAVVTRNFVTGIAAITLVNPALAGAPLAEVPEGETYPVISEGRSNMDEIAGRVSQVGEMAAVALTNVNQLLDANNREAVMAAVRNLRDLSSGLNQRLAALDDTLQRTGRAADRIGLAATQLGQAGKRVAGQAERSGTSLDGALGEAQRTLADARVAIGRIADASEAVQRQAIATARRIDDRAASVDDELGAALSEMRLAIETASRTFDRLREPRAALFGPGRAQLGPGEKLP